MSSAAPGVRTRSLRARVRNAITLITVGSLLLFELPLAVLLGRLIESQALAGLQRDATRGVARVPDNTLERSSAVKAPPSRGDTLVGVYDAQGSRRRQGTAALPSGRWSRGRPRARRP